MQFSLFLHRLSHKSPLSPLPPFIINSFSSSLRSILCRVAGCPSASLLQGPDPTRRILPSQRTQLLQVSAPVDISIANAVWVLSELKSQLPSSPATASSSAFTGLPSSLNVSIFPIQPLIGMVGHASAG